MSAVVIKRKREDLVREIANALQEWPDLERGIFIQAHYHGQSPESISRSIKLDADKVSIILRHCDRKLQAALRGFHVDDGCTATLIPSSAECPAARA